MASNAAIDYTTYDIRKGLLKLSLPAMGSSVFSALYDLANVFWLARLSTAAVAGVTTAMSLYWFGSMFNDLFGTPCVILFSRRYSEKDQKGMQQIFSQTIIMKLTFACLFILFTFFLQETLLHLLGSKGEALDEAMKFFGTRLWFMPIAFASYTINTAFRATGDVNRFAILQLAASIFNIVFDPVLIFVCKLGVRGAAITTGLAETMVLLVGLYWLQSGKSRVKLSLFAPFKLDWALFKKMLALGLPTIVDSGSNNLIGLYCIRILNSYGVVVVAAWGIVSRIRTILFMISFSLEMAVTTLVGQNLGVGQKERAREAALTGIKVDVMLVGIYSLLTAIFAPWVVQFFKSDPTIIQMGTNFLRIMAVGDLFFAGYMACLGGIAGAGGTKINMKNSLFCNWFILAPALALIAIVLKLPPLYLPLAFVLCHITLFILSYRIIRGDRWLNTQL